MRRSPEDLSMRRVLFLLAAGLIVLPPGPMTLADFLKPENWEGLSHLWKNDGKTIVGETTEDPKVQHLLTCTKAKYSTSS